MTASLPTSPPSSPNPENSRRELIAHAQAMVHSGLNKGTAGNLSLRTTEQGQDGFLITPTGMSYDALTTADVPFVELTGKAHGARRPSSEWRMHLDLYRAAPEAGAILHAHSPFATALACLRRDIPPFHYMIARFGGDTIRCAPYALFGSQALSDVAVLAMRERRACLLGNHGMLVAARALPEALALGIEFEALCEHYWRACQLGDPVLLTPEEMAAAITQFAGYGKQPDSSKPPDRESQ